MNKVQYYLTVTHSQRTAWHHAQAKWPLPPLPTLACRMLATQTSKLDDAAADAADDACRGSGSAAEALHCSACSMHSEVSASSELLGTEPGSARKGHTLVAGQTGQAQLPNRHAITQT